MIDLRSDTVTKPTAEMREAMAQAEVGDDVLGDDPTVIELEKRTAEILGTEAAVYVASGTMANQMAIRAHTEPGDEMLCDRETHSYYYECGGPAALSGVTMRLLDGVRGIFTAEDVKSALRPPNVHFPATKLIFIENTHNRGGGSIWPLERIDEVAQLAGERQLKMHLDGARLWNASVATGIAEGEYAGFFDSVSVCFSKGLGAPVGSALAGSGDFIERARRFRKMLGGGMRQAGIIAAGALHALEHHRERLAEDHTNARKLAEALAGIGGIEINPRQVETNIVFFRLTSLPAAQFEKTLHERGVGVLALGEDTIRAVTNLMVTGEDIDRAIEIIQKAAARN